MIKGMIRILIAVVMFFTLVYFSIKNIELFLGLIFIMVAIAGPILFIILINMPEDKTNKKPQPYIRQIERNSKQTIVIEQHKRSRYISTETKQIVWNRDGGRCVQCDSMDNIEYDHDIPHSKGGSNGPNNIQLLCFACNRSKSAKIK